MKRNEFKINRSPLITLFAIIFLSVGMLTCVARSESDSENEAIQDRGPAESEDSDGLDLRLYIRKEMKNYVTFSMQTLPGFPLYFNTRVREVVPGINLKKASAVSLRTCRKWQRQLSDKFPEQVKSITECKAEGSVCDSSKRVGCITEYSAGIEFKSPQTLYIMTKVFVPKGAPDSANEACLSWLKNQESALKEFYIFGACNLSDRSIPASNVIAEISTLPSLPISMKEGLEGHNMSQALSRHTNFFMRMTDSETLTFTPLYPSNPRSNRTKAEKRAKSDCDNFRTLAMGSFSKNLKSLTACSEKKISCDDSNPPICSRIYNIGMQFKQASVVYSLSRTFQSKGSADEASSECRKWLQSEKSVAEEAYLTSSCRFTQQRVVGAAQIFEVEGEIRELDLL